VRHTCDGDVVETVERAIPDAAWRRIVDGHNLAAGSTLGSVVQATADHDPQRSVLLVFLRHYG